MRFFITLHLNLVNLLRSVLNLISMETIHNWLGKKMSNLRIDPTHWVYLIMQLGVFLEKERLSRLCLRDTASLQNLKKLHVLCISGWVLQFRVVIAYCIKLCFFNFTPPFVRSLYFPVFLKCFFNQIILLIFLLNLMQFFN